MAGGPEARPGFLVRCWISLTDAVFPSVGTPFRSGALPILLWCLCIAWRRGSSVAFRIVPVPWRESIGSLLRCCGRDEHWAATLTTAVKNSWGQYGAMLRQQLVSSEPRLYYSSQLQQTLRLEKLFLHFFIRGWPFSLLWIRLDSGLTMKGSTTLRRELHGQSFSAGGWVSWGRVRVWSCCWLGPEFSRSTGIHLVPQLPEAVSPKSQLPASMAPLRRSYLKNLDCMPTLHLGKVWKVESESCNLLIRTMASGKGERSGWAAGHSAIASQWLWFLKVWITCGQYRERWGRNTCPSVVVFQSHSYLSLTPSQHMDMSLPTVQPVQIMWLGL